MGRRFNFISTAIVVAILFGAFGIFAYNIGAADNGEVTSSPVARLGFAKTRFAPVTVTVTPSGLAIPVAGVKASDLVDTFTAARGGGTRRHDAIDIMAPSGTPIVNVAPGTVEKLYNSVGRGGISAYVRSTDGRWIYYYAHLQEYAPGLIEGQTVARGDPIGLVGFTGAASPDGPHLHFAINAMNPNEKWWQGTPINPYPVLAGKQANR